MKQLIGLVLLLTALVIADQSILGSVNVQRAAGSRLLRLERVSTEKVAAIKIKAGRDSEWVYLLRNGSWRYPGLHDAYLVPSRVDQLLGSLLDSRGTVLNSQVQHAEHYGLTADEAVTVELADDGGGPLLRVGVGRGAPGPESTESYVQRVGEQRVMRLHANPRLALGTTEPPMLDPHVLPLALKRRPWSKIMLVHGSERRVLIRIELAPTEPAASRFGPEPAWISHSEGRVDTCLTGNVFAFTRFLKRLRYDQLHGGANNESLLQDPAGRLELTDEAGAVDVLLVGPRLEQITLLHNQTAGQIFSITNEKADLLFPSRSALLDSLPQPAPYDRVEPLGG